MTKALICSLLILTIFGCELPEDLAKFDLSHTTSTTIPSTTVVDIPVSFATPVVETDTLGVVDARGSSLNNIESIKIKSLTLSISSPETANFNFLREIKIYIEAGEYSERLLASLENLENTNATTLDLETTAAELRNYIGEDSYQLRVEILTDEVIAEDIELEISNAFEIEAKLL